MSADLQPLQKPNPWVRRLISVPLVAYLFVVLLGPLASPPGSAHLTQPIAKKVRPIHHALFLGQGYRFFAPDPGPSHIVEFEITQSDGSKQTGVFPDRNGELASPRLNYHRWFMLSETIWSEHSRTPLKRDFDRQQRALTKLAERKTIAGNFDTAKQLRAEVKTNQHSYDRTRQRIDELVRAVGKGLLKIHGGEKIKMTLRERSIPFPIDVKDGAKLTDARYLGPQNPPFIGEFSRTDLGLDDSAEENAKPTDRQRNLENDASTAQGGS